MKGLLIKDFRLMKAQKTFFLLLAAVAVCMTLFSDETLFAVGFLSFVMPLFSLSSISYDEFDNGNAFLFSLPVSRSLYAAEKYCFGLILGTAAWGFSTVLALCAAVYRNTAEPSDVVLSSLVILALTLLVQALMLPFHLKFGGEKGRFAILGALGAAALIGAIAVKAAEAAGIDLASALNHLPAAGLGSLIAAAAAGTGIIWLLSLRISVSIVKKKEF